MSCCASEQQQLQSQAKARRVRISQNDFVPPKPRQLAQEPITATSRIRGEGNSTQVSQVGAKAVSVRFKNVANASIFDSLLCGDECEEITNYGEIYSGTSVEVLEKAVITWLLIPKNKYKYSTSERVRRPPWVKPAWVCANLQLFSPDGSPKESSLSAPREAPFVSRTWFSPMS